MRAPSLAWAATGLAIALTGCGKPASTSASGGEAAAPAAEAPAPTAAEKAATLAALPAPYHTADLAAGEAKFGVCKSCHTIAPGGANMTGPNLHGVFGRKAGTAPGFNYSDAVKAAGFNWDLHHLDSWLANPRTFLPGTKMTFVGFKDPKDRVDVIAYLAVETGYKVPAAAP